LEEKKNNVLIVIEVLRAINRLLQNTGYQPQIESIYMEVLELDNPYVIMEVLEGLSKSDKIDDHQLLNRFENSKWEQVRQKVSKLKK